MSTGTMTRRFFISEHLNRRVRHGGIGNVDIERILQHDGYRALRFPAHEEFGWRAKMRRFLYLVKTWIGLQKGDRVVFQYPLYARMDQFLARILMLKGIQPVVIIADIDGLKDGRPALLRKEIRQLRRFDKFIVHNVHMEQFLREQGLKGKFSILEFFDFLTTPVNRIRNLSFEIVFAGNLQKSGFLSEISKLLNTAPRIQFYLYGEGGQWEPATNLHFEGVFNPPELAEKLQGSFGLLWDGDSIEGMTGSLGTYLSYISHHKLSLYILAGLPVITHPSAGSAYLLAKYGIGFTISKLDELQERIAGLSEEEYQSMASNCRKLAPRISSGSCLREALQNF